MKIEVGMTGPLEMRISPPQRRSVTIPLTVDGRDVGLRVYVCLGAFVPDNTDAFDAAVKHVVELLRAEE